MVTALAPQMVEVSFCGHHYVFVNVFDEGEHVVQPLCKVLKHIEAHYPLSPLWLVGMCGMGVYRKA